jgi:O-antigen/teichoic acid export membrane protein
MSAAIPRLSGPGLRSGRIYRLGKELSWILIGEVAAIVGALVGVRILTTLLTPAVYGKLALCMTAATLVNQLIFGPLSNGAARFYAPAREANAIPEYITALHTLTTRATGACIVLSLAVCASLCVAGKREWLFLALSTSCFALISGWNTISSGIQGAARQRTVVALHAGLASWGRFLAAAGLTKVFGGTTAIAMLGYTIGMAGVVVSQQRFLRRTIPLPTRHEVGTSRNHWRQEILAYSWPFAAWGGFTWAQLSSDRWALGSLTSAREVGLYAVLFQLGYYPMSMLTNLVVQLLSPVLFERAGDASDVRRVESARRVGRTLTTVSLILSATVALALLPIHRLLFAVCVAPAYGSVSYLIPWVILSGGVFASAQLLALEFMSTLTTRRLLAPKIVTALIAVLVNGLGAWAFGLPGVVGGGLIFSVIFFLWVYARVVREK